MSETIRYASGQSSLGPFVAACSDRGLVAFEFADSAAAPIEALRTRFPTAHIVEDDTAMAATIERLAAVVDHPDRDPGLVLDLRGSEYEMRVWNALREIPAGRTVTYGDIATKLGAPRDTREVAEACAANTLAILVPCHRVVKKDGALAGYRWGYKRKRALLAREQEAFAFQLSA
jgi:AraC family transcriptional regulator, regulatory protein of adaptative response / methylated-DNA-[protein]-cysteine methyltransferase